MTDDNEISITSICGGAVPEIFQRELYEVLKNIADPNTNPEKTRTITLKFIFKPTEDMSSASIDMACRSSLQPVKLRKTQLFLSRHTGSIRAYAVDQRQAELFAEPDPKQSIQVVK